MNKPQTLAPATTPRELWNRIITPSSTPPLRETPQFLHALLENCADALVLVDSRGVVVYASPACNRISGCSGDELVGRDVFEFVHPDDRTTLNQIIAALAQPGATTTAQYRQRHKDGSWVWVETTAKNLLGDPRVQAIIVNYRDISRRKRAEAKLRESEDRFAKAFHLNPVAMSIASLEGRFIDVNESFLRLFGYRRDEVIGRTSLELNMWANPTQRAGIAEMLVQKKSARDLKGEFRTKSGEIRQTFAYAEIVEIGGEEYVLVLLHDVTDAERAAEALRDSEGRYRELFDNANDVIYMLDLNGRFLSVNRAGERLSGYTSEELVAMNITDLLAPEYRELAHQKIKDKIASGEMTAYELEIIKKDGGRLSLEVSTRLVYENGKPVAVQGIARDMTERKRAERALRESEERYRLLSEATFEGIGISENGKVVDANTRLAEMLGYHPEEMIGKNVIDFVAPESRERMLEHDTSGLLDEPFEHLVLRKDGSTFPAESRGRTIPYEGRMVRVAAIRDICERKRAEEEIHRRANQFAGLYEIMRDLSIQWNLPVLLQRIIDHAVALLGASSGGTIYLYDNLRNDLYVAVNSGTQVAIGTRLALGEGMAGRVAKMRQFLIVDDYKTWEGRSPQFDGIPFGAVIQTPMLYGGELIGVLTVREMSDSKRKYTQADAHLLSLFAGQAASAVHNARLFEETQMRLGELETVNKISTALRASQTLEEMLPVLIDEALELAGTNAGGIWLDGTGRDKLHAAVARGWFTQVVEPPVCTGECIADHVFATGQPYLSREFISDPRTSTATRSQIPEGWGGVCVPIRAGKEVIGVLFISVQLPREVTPSEVRVLTTLAEIAGNAIHRTRLHESLEASYDTTLEGWSRALDLRDKETEGHTQRVTATTVQLARAMGVPEDQLVHIRRGALLHDIGKMAIPDGILLKPGPLDESEWEIMRRHPIYACEMLAPIEYLGDALDIPHYHHERWDGSGYPCGLKGEAIPLAARIFAVVDVWDALCSKRPYRAGWDETNARDYIRTGAGIHFDPRVVEEFLKMAF